MHFAYPGFLFLLLLIPLLIARYARGAAGAPLVYSDIKRVKNALRLRGGGVRTRIAGDGLFALRLMALILFILAMARPRTELVSTQVYSEGVDIMLTVDVSGSMNLIDLDMQNQRTRLEVTKDAVKRFVNGRGNDRIGMTVFATDAYLQCPLTIDYDIVDALIDQVHIGMVPENSTAIGNALASSLNRLRYSETKSKVIVLITDGANNDGQIDPFTAAELAKTLGVKIYTIGVGGLGTPYVKVTTILGEQLRPYPEAERIDEKSLQKIADITGGQYFRAVDVNRFQEIFDEIDRLEKTEIKSEAHRRYNEMFGYFLIPALCLLALEVGLSQTRYRKLP
ncbi:MAG: VWA domain-containing protein [bacterium]|nr:VWA domain-containing protein [bacterium]